jgi:integrase
VPRKRLAENAPLPRRWRHTRNAYYYQVPPGLEHLWDGKQTFKLGDTLPAAYKAWSDRIGVPLATGSTVAQLLERYALEVVPTKAPKTQAGNYRAIPRLTKAVGHFRITQLEPQHVYHYVEARDAKTAAHREVEVLSHAFTKAVQWGLLKRHPFKRELRLEGIQRKTRYVADEEVIAALAAPCRMKRGSVLMIQAYIRVKLMTGLRREDLLRLNPGRDFKPDGIAIQPRKTAKTTGKRVFFPWTPELRAAVEAALAVRPVDIAPLLFCTRDGECYISEENGDATGWDSMWQRFMARLLKTGAIERTFTERSLRGKAGSDEESLEAARQLLAHADARVTDRFYRLKGDVVQPTGAKWKP